jgi:hypothetical protein
MELQLEELEASATEDEIAVGTAEPDPTTVLGILGPNPNCLEKRNRQCLRFLHQRP